jgi:hypothetical protein
MQPAEVQNRRTSRIFRVIDGTTGVESGLETCSRGGRTAGSLGQWALAAARQCVPPPQRPNGYWLTSDY